MKLPKIYPLLILTLITGPIRVEVDNNRIILTHLQKYSHFGFLFTWPFCFHFWLFWQLQQGTEGNWKEGTEQGVYFRTPGYRWDSDLGMKWTWGYFGLHWD